LTSAVKNILSPSLYRQDLLQETIIKSIFVIFGFPYVDQLVNVLSAGRECLLFSTFLFSRKCTSYNNLFILFSMSYGLFSLLPIYEKRCRMPEWWTSRIFTFSTSALYQLIPTQIHHGEMPFCRRIKPPDGALNINDTQH
jgi:hypothetical protein